MSLQCPLCEALFTRYEIALDEQLDFLAPLYYAALSAHARRPHDFVTTLDVSMYMTTPLAVYHRWLAARGVAGGEEGR